MSSIYLYLSRRRYTFSDIFLMFNEIIYRSVYNQRGVRNMAVAKQSRDTGRAAMFGGARARSAISVDLCGGRGLLLSAQSRLAPTAQYSHSRERQRT